MSLISREAAIKHLYGRLIESANNNVGVWEDAGIVFEDIATERLKTWIYEIPTAEPEKEKAKRVLWTGWKGYRDTRYKCPNCKKPVKNDDVYCHRCGQRLMFPHISFTDYIPGKMQETIVRWDDE